MPSRFADGHWQKRRALLGELLRFGATGALATAIHTAAAWSFLLVAGTGAGAVAANLVGFCTAFAWSFCGNAWWVFRHHGSAREVFPRFLALSLATLALLSLVSAVSDSLALSPYIALAVIVCLIPGVSYLGNKFWVFRRRNGAPA